MGNLESRKRIGMLVNRNWLLDKDYWHEIFKDLGIEIIDSIIEDLKNTGELNNANIAKKIIELTIKNNLEIPISFKDARIFSPQESFSEGEKIIIIHINGDIKTGSIRSIKRVSGPVLTINRVGHYMNYDSVSIQYSDGTVSPLPYTSGPEYYKIKQEDHPKFITPDLIVEKNLGFLQPILKEKLSESKIHSSMATASLGLFSNNVLEEDDLPLGRRAPAPRIESKFFVEEYDYRSEGARPFREVSLEEWEAIKVEAISIELMFAHFFHGFLPYNDITKKVFNPKHKTIVLRDASGREIRLKKSVEKRMFYNRNLSKFLQPFEVYAGTLLYIKRIGMGNQYLVEFKEFPQVIKDCRIVKYDTSTKDLYYELKDLQVRYECTEPLFKSELRFQDLKALWEEARRSGLSIPDITYMEFKKLYDRNYRKPVCFLDIYYKVFFKRMCSPSAVWSVLQRNPKVFRYLGNKYWTLVGEQALLQQKDLDIEDEEGVLPSKMIIIYGKPYSILQIIAIFLFIGILVWILIIR